MHAWTPLAMLATMLATPAMPVPAAKHIFTRSSSSSSSSSNSSHSPSPSHCHCPCPCPISNLHIIEFLPVSLLNSSPLSCFYSTSPPWNVCVLLNPLEFWTAPRTSTTTGSTGTPTANSIDAINFEEHPSVLTLPSLASHWDAQLLRPRTGIATTLTLTLSQSIPPFSPSSPLRLEKSILPGRSRSLSPNS